MNMDEVLEKGKAAKNPEELKALAAGEGWEMTDEEAAQNFEELQRCLAKRQKSGELSDDELDDVSGGGCYKGKRLVVTTMHSCMEWSCKCGNPSNMTPGELVNLGRCPKCRRGKTCGNCKYCSYEKGLWLCNNPKNMK